MLEAARERARRHELPCEFVWRDAEALPFEDGTFDVVTNRIVIWSLPNPGVAVREWARVLAPGGRIFLFGNHPDHEPPRALKELARIAYEARARVSGGERSFGYGADFGKTWKAAQAGLPFHHAPAPKIKALFDAAGLVETAVVPIGHRIGEKQRTLLKEEVIPWHVVYGEKPEKENE